MGTTWFYVTGILQPAPLAPDVDSSILIGYPAVQHHLGFDGHPSTIYLRANDSAVPRRAARMPPTQALWSL